MAKKAKIIGEKLISYLDSLEKTRQKLEIAFDKKNINKRDIHKIYDGLFLNAVGSFENFLEELFIGLLSDTLEVSRKLKPRVTFSSIQSARKVLLGNNSFLKWLPYEMTIGSAEIYFFGKTPFNNLEANEISELGKIVVVRNAVAHKSPYALQKFEKNVISGLNLPPSEKDPSGFLRGSFRSSPKQTRYENYINSIAKIAIKLSK